jgi:hypothetical protein
MRLVAVTTLRNRVVMGSMHTGLEDRARDTDRPPRERPYSARRRAVSAWHFRVARAEVSVSSGLPERLDLQADGDLVADDGAAGFKRHVNIDAEVLAVQHD